MSRPIGSQNGVIGKNIDKKQFEKLCSYFCREDEICDFFGVDEDTMLKWCHQTYDRTFVQARALFNSRGRISLRKAQFEMAMKIPSMAIWVGKQELGQTDVSEFKTDNRVQVIGVVPTENNDEENNPDNDPTD